jgi:Formiminotransferase domain, N-terminal subdomain
MQKIIECVPNFSEGRELEIIQQITAASNYGGRCSMSLAAAKLLFPGKEDKTLT